MGSMTTRVFAHLAPQDVVYVLMLLLALNALPQPPEINQVLVSATAPMAISLTLPLSDSAEDAPTTLLLASISSKP